MNNEDPYYIGPSCEDPLHKKRCFGYHFCRELESDQKEIFLLTPGADFDFKICCSNMFEGMVHSGIAETRIIGMRHQPLYRVFMESLYVGMKVTLVAEPDNQFDPEAVAAYVKDVKIGYVPSREAGFIRLFLDSDMRLDARLDEISDSTLEVSFRAVISRLDEVVEDVSYRCFEQSSMLPDSCDDKRGIPVSIADLAEKLSPDYSLSSKSDDWFDKFWDEQMELNRMRRMSYRKLSKEERSAIDNNPFFRRMQDEMGED